MPCIECNYKIEIVQVGKEDNVYNLKITNRFEATVLSYSYV